MTSKTKVNTTALDLVIEPALDDLRKCLSEPEVIATMNKIPANLQTPAAIEFARRSIAAKEIRYSALRYVGFSRLSDTLGEQQAKELIASL